MLPKEKEVLVLEAVEQFITKNDLAGKIKPTEVFMMIAMFEYKMLQHEGIQYEAIKY